MTGLIAVTAVAVAGGWIVVAGPIALRQGRARDSAPATGLVVSGDAPVDAGSMNVVALLNHLIRANYHHAATAPPETALGYQRIADVLSAAHPAMSTDHPTQLPASQVADQIAASLFVRLRAVPVGTPEYDELDGIRRHFHHLRQTATHHHGEMT